MRCRGRAVPSRHRTGGKCGPMLKRQWPPKFVIARRPEADVAISCRQLRFRRQLSHNPARYCEIATGAKRPRNDNSGGVTPQNPCATCCWPAWRSGSAATDAIGSYRFIARLFVSPVRRRERHAAPLQFSIEKRKKLPEAQASGNFHNQLSIIYFAKTFFRRAKRGRPSS